MGGIVYTNAMDMNFTGISLSLQHFINNAETVGVSNLWKGLSIEDRCQLVSACAKLAIELPGLESKRDLFIEVMRDVPASLSYENGYLLLFDAILGILSSYKTDLIDKL